MSPTPERRRAVEELYLAAVKRLPEQRAAFLKEICPDDALRLEVESLLRFEREDAELMPPSSGVQATGLEKGMRLGPYEIESQLGAGGMGEVWKARDTRLGRSVAVKVSKTEFSNRFEREARAVAALNHPNIATLYDVGPNYFVMEYIDGKPLQQLIPRKGLSLSETLSYAVQIADALAAAHAAGIVHRDLKPGNVMITSSGQVKVVDFGVAHREAPKRLEPEDPTFTQTAAGVVAGTVCYMSPEQAQGRPVDARSDIFSFGTVLYEMLAGVRPFRGDSAAAIMAGILTREPDPIRDLPHDVERLLHRCLQKDPVRRAQSMADVKVTLLELKEESESVRLHGPGSQVQTVRRPSILKAPRWKLWVIMAAGAAILATAGLGVVWLLYKRGKPSTPLTIVPLTTYAGWELYPSFSPDGNQVAFSWDGEKQDNFDIYIKQVDGVAPVRLTTDPAKDNYPAWSPDGRSIAFTRSLGARQAVILIPSIGGPEHKLLEITGSGVAWSPDAKYLVFGDGKPSSLYLYSVTTGERKQLTTPPADSVGDDFPAFSPDGRRLAFIRSLSFSSNNIYDLSLGPGFQPVAAPVRISKTGRFSAPAWTGDGRELVFSQYGNSVIDHLWRMDATSGAPPTLVLSEGAISPAISRQGSRMAFAREMTDNNIWRAPTHDSPEKSPAAALIASTLSDETPRYSPDGKQIVFMSDRSGHLEVWLAAADGTNQVQLTALNGDEAGAPSWSPDGQRIVFGWNSSGTTQIYTIPVSGGKPLQLTNSPPDCGSPRYSRDGKWIYFVTARSGRSEVWKIPSQGGQPVQVTQNGGHSPTESPDGAWLYFVRGGSLRTPLLKMPSAGGPETQVVSAVFLRSFVPASDGVYFLQKDEGRLPVIRFLKEATGAVREVQSLTKPLWAQIDLSPDEQYILWTQADRSGSDLMMIENFR